MENSRRQNFELGSYLGKMESQGHINPSQGASRDTCAPKNACKGLGVTSAAAHRPVVHLLIVGLQEPTDFVCCEINLDVGS